MSGIVRASANKLFVGNLPWTVNSSELRKYFSEFGSVAIARVVFDKQKGLSKGFGYVSFDNPESAESVLKHPQHIIEGHYVVIQPTH